MAKEEIKKLVKESAEKLDKQLSDDIATIKDNLASFKKKTLSKI